MPEKASRPLRRGLGLFARAPLPGQAKTRLAPALTPEGAAALYRCFFLDTVGLATGVRSWETVIFYTPRRARQALRDVVQEPLELVPQSRGNLGERMSRAFQELFARGHRLAVLIGGDLPTLPLGRLRAAFSALEQRPVVLGPATDGGYYLIGLRAPQPELFEGVAWGTPRVLGQTLDRLHRLGLAAACLEPWYDVDTADDLRFLVSHLRLLMASGSPVPHHTVDYLRQLGLL